MKDKVLKILFIISFLPYIAILILGITSIFTGIGGWMGTSKQYGLEAFLTVISLCVFFLWPLFLVCFIFQYWYNKKNIEDKSNKKIVNICSILGYIVLLVGLIYNIFELIQ